MFLSHKLFVLLQKNWGVYALYAAVLLSGNYKIASDGWK